MLYGNNNPTYHCTTAMKTSILLPHSNQQQCTGCCTNLHQQQKDFISDFMRVLKTYSEELIDLRLSLTSSISATKYVKQIDEHFKTVQNLLRNLSISPSAPRPRRQKSAGNFANANNNNNQNSRKRKVAIMAGQLRNNRDEEIRDAINYTETTTAYDEHDGEIFNAKMRRKESRNQTNKSTLAFVYSCGEKYLGTLHGYPLYNVGFAPKKSSKQCKTLIQTNRSTSLILDRPFIFEDDNVVRRKAMTMRMFNETLRFVVGKFHEIHILFRTSSKSKISLLATTILKAKEITRQYSNIHIHTVRGGENINDHLNRLYRNLPTRFVVMATQTVLINHEFNLERMLHVYERQQNRYAKVQIVASSLKNFRTGVWDSGCYRTTLKLYNLVYKAGYSTSVDSCMKCDFAAGAYLMATNISAGFGDNGNKQPFPFRSNDDDTVHEDLFLRLTTDINKRCGHISTRRSYSSGVLVCPDSMIYSIPKTVFTKSELQNFSNLWNASFIKWHTKQSFRFEQISPANNRTKLSESIAKCRVGLGLAVPPFCLSLLYHGIEFVSRLFDKHRIPYMLIEGSALGAVKFEGLLPWEQDSDVAIQSTDFPKLEILEPEFVLQNYTLVIDEKATRINSANSTLWGGVAHIRVYHWSLQIFGFHRLKPAVQNSSIDFINPAPPTKIRFENSMNKNEYFYARAPENPAKYCRNRYGQEIFKHAEHWMMRRKKSGWEKYNSGHFEKCAVSGHNACLDQFEADGNDEFRRNYE